MNATSILWVVGFVLVFLGERIFGGGEDSWRWILDGSGLLLALLGLGLLLRGRSDRPADQQGPYNLAAGFGLLGLSSLALHALTADAVLGGLDPEQADQARIVLHSLAPIAWLAGTLPLLSIARAITLSPARLIPKLVQQGAMSALAVSFALSMLVPLNYLAAEHNQRWDLGYFRTAQAGARTQAMVAGLEEPVRVVAFFPTGSEVGAEVETYFGPLVTDQLTFERVDHALEPVLAEELKIRDNGYVAFVRGEQVERVKVGDDFDSARRKLRKLDEEMQQSLVKLARGQKVAYFTVGHGELYWRGESDKERSLSTMKKVLTGLNFKVEELGLAEGLGVSVPDDAAVVFVMGASKPFLDEELAALNAYREGGGALVIALEPGDADLSALLEPMGLTANTSAELAIDNYFLKVTGGPGDQHNLVSNKFSTHESVTTLSRNSSQAAVAFPGAIAIEAENAAPGKVNAVIKSLPAAWQDLDGDLEFDAGSEARRQWTLMSAVTGDVAGSDPVMPPADGEDEGEAAAPKPRESRTIVLGDAQWASDLFVLYSGNGQLIVDMLGWLTEDEALTGETESEEDVKIQHTKEGQALWFYGAALFAPALFMVLGLGRVFWRKKQGSK
ncbi:MAG: Gldg family protein [Alphaproteobacteria bacterium]|nr:Gldg family protein [Alphaproteobacteria bacterium]